MTTARSEGFILDGPVDLALTLGPLRRGPRDPCLRLTPTEALRASRTPDGPSTVRVRVRAGTQVEATAWGEGADWSLAHLPDLLGAGDDDSALDSMIAAVENRAGTLLRELRFRFVGLRLTRTLFPTEVLIPVILEQKVPGVSAHRSYRELVQALGDPAPGPTAAEVHLMLPPEPCRLAETPYWVFHGFGIERKRADIVRGACRHAESIDRLVRGPRESFYEGLQSLPGVGQWSAAEVGGVVLGDADAVSLGDYHLPHTVGWALGGRPRSDEHTMLELLEPFRGQRGRVIRLIEAGGIMAPRRGPRMEIRSIRGM